MIRLSLVIRAEIPLLGPSQFLPVYPVYLRQMSKFLSSRLMHQNLLHKIWISLLILAAAKVCYDLTQMLLVEAQGRMNGDVLIYLTVGRGLLNGMRVYSDLFESKPPGILYLAAISLWLTDGTLLMRTLQAISLLFLPLSMAFISRRRFDLLLTGLIFGGLVALWSDNNAGGMQTEIFGVLPMALYGILICKPMSRRSIAVCGACILWAVSFREPYILGIAAAAILVSRTPKRFVNAFVVPALLAGIVFISILLSLHLVRPYFELYLPGMLHNRIQMANDVPLYLRTLWVQRLFSSLTQYSSIPFLGVLLAALWISSITKKRLSILACILGAFGMGELFVLFTVFWKAGSFASITDSGFQPILALYVIGLILYIALLWYIKDRKEQISIVIGLAALPFLNLAIGVGGYGARYLLFLIPAMIALFVLCAERRNTILLSSFLAVMAISYYSPAVEQESMSFYKNARQASNQLNALLERCNENRYVFGGNEAIFAFSPSSPVGPVFQVNVHGYLGFRHPLYIATFENILRARMLIIPARIHDYPKDIISKFDAPVDPCAKDFPDYRVLFRS